MPSRFTVAALESVTDFLGSEAPITRGLLGFCVFVSGLCVASDRRIPLWITDNFASSTLARFGGLFGSLGAAEPWRYLAAVFVHANVLHIGMNGWALTSIGPVVEHEFGRARAVIAFMLTGICGFLLSDQWYGAHGPITVGASGAIFGLFGSVVGSALARRDLAWKSMFVSNLVNLAILGLALHVNNAAHLGGLLAGIGLGFLFGIERRRLGLGSVLVALALVFTALAPASVLLSNASPVWRILRERELSALQ